MSLLHSYHSMVSLLEQNCYCRKIATIPLREYNTDIHRGLLKKYEDYVETLMRSVVVHL